MLRRPATLRRLCITLAAMNWVIAPQRSSASPGLKTIHLISYRANVCQQRWRRQHSFHVRRRNDREDHHLSVSVRESLRLSAERRPAIQHQHTPHSSVHDCRGLVLHHHDRLHDREVRAGAAAPAEAPLARLGAEEDPDHPLQQGTTRVAVRNLRHLPRRLRRWGQAACVALCAWWGETVVELRFGGVTNANWIRFQPTTANASTRGWPRTGVFARRAKEKCSPGGKRGGAAGTHPTTAWAILTMTTRRRCWTQSTTPATTEPLTRHRQLPRD